MASSTMPWTHQIQELLNKNKSVLAAFKLGSTLCPKDYRKGHNYRKEGTMEQRIGPCYMKYMWLRKAGYDTKLSYLHATIYRS